LEANPLATQVGVNKKQEMLGKLPNLLPTTWVAGNLNAHYATNGLTDNCVGPFTVTNTGLQAISPSQLNFYLYSPHHAAKVHQAYKDHRHRRRAVA
jgi:hypothetical protein